MTSIQNIAFDKGSAELITLNISIEQAALIADWAGGWSPNRAGPAYEHVSELYNCLVGEFFYRFYEDGSDEALRELNLPKLPHGKDVGES